MIPFQSLSIDRPSTCTNQSSGQSLLIVVVVVVDTALKVVIGTDAQNTQNSDQLNSGQDQKAKR